MFEIPLQHRVQQIEIHLMQLHLSSLPSCCHLFQAGFVLLTFSPTALPQLVTGTADLRCNSGGIIQQHLLHMGCVLGGSNRPPRMCRMDSDGMIQIKGAVSASKALLEFAWIPPAHERLLPSPITGLWHLLEAERLQANSQEMLETSCLQSTGNRFNYMEILSDTESESFGSDSCKDFARKALPTKHV